MGDMRYLFWILNRLLSVLKEVFLGLPQYLKVKLGWYISICHDSLFSDLCLFTVHDHLSMSFTDVVTCADETLLLLSNLLINQLRVFSLHNSHHLISKFLINHNSPSQKPTISIQFTSLRSVLYGTFKSYSSICAYFSQFVSRMLYFFCSLCVLLVCLIPSILYLSMIVSEEFMLQAHYYALFFPLCQVQLPQSANCSYSVCALSIRDQVLHP